MNARAVSRYREKTREENCLTIVIVPLRMPGTRETPIWAEKKFIARRYASAVYVVALRLSVRHVSRELYQNG